MPGYSSVDVVAERLKVPVEKLWEFEDFGWILIVEREGTLFIPAHQEYKAVLILRLQRLLTLNPREISEILRTEKPPYSFQDVDRILAKRQAADPDAEPECFHEAAD